MSLTGDRIADDPIYLNEDRSAEPKEIFKFVRDAIAADERGPGTKLCDVGCATGEFLDFLSRCFSDFSLYGLDVSAPMIADASKRFPKISFRVASAIDPSAFTEPEYDVTTSIGVLSCFDAEDAETMIRNLVACTRDGGSVFLSSKFNPDPVDVLMRYRRAGQDAAEQWETGWNIYSQSTVDGLLASSQRDLSWSWKPFRLPFALPKRDDPMRAWTMETAEDPNQQINGACQLLYFDLLHIRVGQPGGRQEA